MKATVDEQIFHQRLLGREDPIAFAELAVALYDDVVRRTRARAGPAADSVLVEEAVGKAFLDYNDNPERYNPELSSLRTYLTMVAYDDFQKAQKREYRRVQRQARQFDEAYIDDDSAAAVDDTEQLIIRLRAAEVWPHVSAAFTDPVERQVLFLIIDDVRETSEYVKVLGVNQMSEDEQTQYVNRVKNRVKKRLRRIGEKFDE
jgi:hypothetical protein